MGAGAILYCGIVPYDSIRQRPQWLADALSERAPLLYLQPNASILRGKLSGRGLERVGEQMAVLDLGSVLPLSGYWRVLNRANYRRVARGCQRAFDRLGWEPTVLLASFPKQIDLLPHFAELPIVYDVMDDYPEFFGRRESALLAGMHTELLKRADEVVTSSHYLAEQCQAQSTTNPVVIENAAAPIFFEEPERASDTRFARPCFGYIGALADWLDYEALIALARAYPQGSIVLAGPEHHSVPELPPNVQLLGQLPHAELPALLAQVDVGLVPFVVSDATQGVNPVKVYEYLASGLPVLATPCAELQRFEHGVRVAPASDWPRVAAELLQSLPPRAELREHVRNETWSQRGEALWGVLHSLT